MTSTPLTREEFKTFMEEKAFRAINVTIPYKKDVIPYLDSMDDNAKAVMDVVYNPLPTKLHAQAKELGMIGVNGLEILVAQAKYAVEIFLDTKIDEDRIQEIYEKMK